MKTYTIIEKGRNIRKFITIPKDFIDIDLEITIKPVRKKKIKFSEFLMDSCTIDKYKKFDRKDLNER